VYADANLNGMWDTVEAYAMTDSSGNYTLRSLPAGTHRVRAEGRTGWRGTTPSAGYHSVTLSAGGSSTGKRFGFTQKVLISGTVFSDANGNRAKDSGEAGLSGWRVFIDANGDGVFNSTERSVLTDAAGNWSFKNLAAGTYRVRVVQQSGWTRTTPTAGYYSVTLTSGQASTGKLFGERRIA